MRTGYSRGGVTRPLFYDRSATDKVIVNLGTSGWVGEITDTPSVRFSARWFNAEPDPVRLPSRLSSRPHCPPATRASRISGPVPRLQGYPNEPRVVGEGSDPAADLPSVTTEWCYGGTSAFTRNILHASLLRDRQGDSAKPQARYGRQMMPEVSSGGALAPFCSGRYLAYPAVSGRCLCLGRYLNVPDFRCQEVDGRGGCPGPALLSSTRPPQHRPEYGCVDIVYSGPIPGFEVSCGS